MRSTNNEACSTDRLDLIVNAGESQFQTTLADTNESRTLGLSGRPCLGDTSAMLFVFDDLARHGIWMKDMQFAIDIVWLDASKQIVDIKTNVSPDTYPEVLYPRQEALYVLELNSGRSESVGMVIGDTLRW